MTPLLQKLEARRTEVAKLGDQLIQLGEERDLAKQGIVTAGQKVSDTQAALIKAKQDAAAAAAAALRARAALPPGTPGSGLADLDALSRMQRGESVTAEAAARQLAILQATLTAATAEQATATTNATELSARYDKLHAQITTKQAALQKLEREHAAEISAAEAAESAADRALGQEYLAGAPDGRGADPRALAALTFALAQQGDPYVWSEEGPDQYDCSGLTFAAYRSPAAGRYPLQRVSRDQYNQTYRKTVTRYSLLPGDLLFFSSSNSWQDIHHVAMYAGRGMMVEAPRSGLNVRVVPVRWTRLFQATRVYGSVEGVTEGPALGRPPAPNGPSTTGPTTPATNPPATNPPATNPPSSPPPSSPSSPPPSSPSSPPPSSPSSPPPSSEPPTTNPAPDPDTSSTGGASSPTDGSSSTTGGSTSGGSTSGGSTSGDSTSGGSTSGGSTSGGESTSSGGDSTSSGGESPSETTSAPESTSSSSTATSAPEPSTSP
ncbi:MAG TPA: C40 family peptidase [Actinoplanes sp.]|nr:C40 family peptidase [Actinoplanes sp.]